MTAQLTEREAPLTHIAPSSPRRPHEVHAFSVSGDFNCPWSYLAFRRAGVLSAAGVDVDWHAVEHAPWTPRRAADDRLRQFAEVRDELEQVSAMLLPGEQLPYDLHGFWPVTRPAVAAYAQAYAVGLAPRVLRLLFESYWMHGLDIGDVRTLRTLLVDELRGLPSSSEATQLWGYATDVTGGPISTDAWRLVQGWTREWRQSGERAVPVVRVAGTTPIVGVAAVEWLGEELVRRGLELDARPDADSTSLSLDEAAAVEVARSCHELPSQAWATDHGHAWHPRCHHAPRRDRLRHSGRLWL